MPKLIQMAIVGTGGMGACHAQEFSRIPGVKIMAVCDVD